MKPVLINETNENNCDTQLNKLWYSVFLRKFEKIFWMKNFLFKRKFVFEVLKNIL